MNHKAVKAVRMAATISLLVSGAMAMCGDHATAVRSTGAGAEIAKPVAGLLIPARTRLIMDYKRIALA